MESSIYNQILLIASKLRKVVLFRNNTGMGWVGKVIKKTPTTITLENARPLHAGLIKGSSDLIGWTIIDIQPHHVGQKMAVFTAFEVKTKTGRPSAPQRNFVERVNEAGGIAGFIEGDAEINTLINQRQNGEYTGHKGEGED